MSIPEALRYGAAELKKVYNRNLGMALGISVGIHLALIGLYIFGLNIGKADSEGKAAPVSKVKLTTLAPPPVEDATPPPPPPMIPPQLQTGGGGGGVASRAGTPVAVPDALLDPQVQDFATTAEIPVATPEGGDGTGFGPKTDGDGLGDPINVDKPVQVKDVEKLPDMDEFVAVEEMPKWDQGELQRRIKYPEIARRNNIEGTVVVRALVDKHGSVVQTHIDKSDNQVLSDAAIDAVKATPFTPAIQNGTSVPVWVQIPVTFRLN
jgi:protein TonB